MKQWLQTIMQDTGMSWASAVPALMCRACEAAALAVSPYPVYKLSDSGLQINMPYPAAAGARSADERAAVNSAVQGSGADKLKAAMVALQGRLGDGTALPRGTCRLVHSVSGCLWHRCFRLLDQSVEGPRQEQLGHKLQSEWD
jgi:hypothetical protein